MFLKVDSTLLILQPILLPTHFLLHKSAATEKDPQSALSFIEGTTASSVSTSLVLSAFPFDLFLKK